MYIVSFLFMFPNRTTCSQSMCDLFKRVREKERVGTPHVLVREAASGGFEKGCLTERVRI